MNLNIAPIGFNFNRNFSKQNIHFGEVDEGIDRRDLLSQPSEDMYICKDKNEAKHILNHIDNYDVYLCFAKKTSKINRDNIKEDSILADEDPENMDDFLERRTY